MEIRKMLRSFNDVSRPFQESFNEVSWMFEEYFLSIAWVFETFFKDIESFRSVTRVFQRFF